MLGSGPACVWTDPGYVKESGLGEPFGKASLANTVSGRSRLVSMTGRDLRGVEGWLPIPSKAWPDEVLERGLPRPFAKRRKNRGRVNRIGKGNSRDLFGGISRIDKIKS
jgi:hypothetical protein